jgi:hypothetical protein
METKLQFDRKRSKVKFCPCGKSNKNGKFVPFIGFNDKGYCHSCGKTFFPDSDTQQPVKFNPKPEPPKPPDTINNSLVDKSLAGYASNNFVTYLLTIFPEQTVNDLCSSYKIGTSRHWGGSTIFWQVDVNGNVRSGKIMKYDSSGHRVKEPFAHITWVHRLLKLEAYNLQQCLFGEHLLSQHPEKIVCIAESEKTAVICSGHLPQFLWLAVGSLSGITAQRFRPLKGRKIFLYPDLNAYKQWQEKAATLHGFDITVSDLLQKKADHIEGGYDIADFLTATRQQPTEPTKAEPTKQFIQICEMVKAGKPIYEAVEAYKINDAALYQLEHLAALHRLKAAKTS